MVQQHSQKSAKLFRKQKNDWKKKIRMVHVLGSQAKLPFGGVIYEMPFLSP
jgi:hypothetical protein